MNSNSHICNCSKKRQRDLNKKRLNESAYRRYDFDERDSQISTASCSDIELPWTDIGINASDLAGNRDCLNFRKKPTKEDELVKKESCEFVQVPWEDLMITDTVDSEKAKLNINKCDSSLEIPWETIQFDPCNMKIEDDEHSKKCENDDVEIPWDDLMLPKNLVLATKNKCSTRKRTQKTKSKKCGCSKSKKTTNN